MGKNGEGATEFSLHATEMETESGTRINVDEIHRDKWESYRK